jgi:hypothetical protein
MALEAAKTGKEQTQPNVVLVKGGQTLLRPIEKQTNCLACNKPINKLRRYYRDGKFYCNKKCWRNFLEKSGQKQK